MYILKCLCVRMYIHKYACVFVCMCDFCLFLKGTLTHLSSAKTYTQPHTTLILIHAPIYTHICICVKAFATVGCINLLIAIFICDTWRLKSIRILNKTFRWSARTWYDAASRCISIVVN